MSGASPATDDPRPGPTDAGPGWRRLGLPARAVAATVAAFVVAGIAAGLLWWRLADPPTWVVVGGRGVLAEGERSRPFGLVWLYAVCAAPPAVVLGAVCGWWQRGLAWTHVLLVTASAAVAALLSWQVGALLGADDPQDRFASLADGTRVAGAVGLDAYGVLLVWPLGAVLALLLVGVLLVPDDASETTPETTPDEVESGHRGTTRYEPPIEPDGTPAADPRNL